MACPASSPLAQASASRDLGKRKGTQTRPGCRRLLFAKPDHLPRGPQRARSFPRSPRPLAPLLAGRAPGPGGSSVAASVSVEHRPHPLAEGAWRLSKGRGQGVAWAGGRGATGQQCLGVVSGPREGTGSPTRTRPALSGLTQGMVRARGCGRQGSAVRGQGGAWGQGPCKGPEVNGSPWSRRRVAGGEWEHPGVRTFERRLRRASAGQWDVLFNRGLRGGAVFNLLLCSVLKEKMIY